MVEEVLSQFDLSLSHSAVVWAVGGVLEIWVPPHIVIRLFL